MAAQALEKHRHGAADRSGVEALALFLQQGVEPGEALGPALLRDVIGLGHGDEFVHVLLPPAFLGTRGVVTLQVLHVPAVIRTVVGRVRAERRQHDAVHEVALEQIEARLVGRELEAIDQRLGADVAAIRRTCEKVVEQRVARLDQRVAEPVRVVDVQQRHVELQRRHRDVHLAVRVRRRDGLQFRVARQHVGAQPAARRQETHAHAGSAQAPLEHALVQLHDLERTRFARLAEVRLERDRVHRHEAVHELPDLAGGAQHADLGPAVGHDREVLQVRAQQFAHQRHRLAPRAPAADAHGHAVAKIRDGLCRRQLLVQRHHLYPTEKSWPQIETRRVSVVVQVFGSTLMPP